MLRQSGKRRSSATGSITAPDRIWAPTSEPFSSTTTETSLPFSAASCFSLIAAASPAGPAPTMTTSNSMVSRSARSLCSVASLEGTSGSERRESSNLKTYYPARGVEYWIIQSSMVMTTRGRAENATAE